jgi:MFS family permease
VWGYSPLRAGLALTPAPVAGALVAGPAGRLADRFGHRVVAFPGALVFAAAGIWYRLRLGAEPSFASEWLPGSLMVGVGLGLAYSTLTSAAVRDLSGPRFAVGSAINAMTRQLGAVLGVALVVAAIGTPTPLEALPAFDRAWTVMAIAALCAAATTLMLGRTTTAA